MRPYPYLCPRPRRPGTAPGPVAGLACDVRRPWVRGVAWRPAGSGGRPDTRASDGAPTGLDEVASRFLARHPDGVGLDLGAGLDTRALRIDPPPTVDWYDVDFPAVVAARAGSIPARPNTHAIGADVTDPDWMAAVPHDRPAVIVADGLLGFPTLDQVVSLLNRLTSHFPSGEIAFNSYPRFAIWAVKHTRGTRSVADLIEFPGSDDPHEPERWNPRLTLVKEILIPREPEVAQFPAVLRTYYRLAAHSTSWSRKGTVVLHYRF